MVSPSAKRQAAAHVQSERGVSQRRASRVVGVGRSTVRYKARPRPDEAELTDLIRALASRHQRYGYRRITALLHREGSTVNTKRVHRIWKREGLQISRRKPRKRRCGPKGEVLKRATHPIHVWSYDFMEDRTEKGGRLRILTVLDEYTRESLAIRVGRSLSAAAVIETLEWLFLTRGVPEYIRSDNGPEFIAQAVEACLHAHGCESIFITPGSPWENPFIESFNGSFRDECLNMELFTNVSEAQEIADHWRIGYNTLRPHSSLDGRTPSEFAAHVASALRPTGFAHLQRQENHVSTLS